jgi:hypothetical protein
MSEKKKKGLLCVIFVDNNTGLMYETTMDILLPIGTHILFSDKVAEKNGDSPDIRLAVTDCTCSCNTRYIFLDVTITSADLSREELKAYLNKYWKY